MVWYISRIVFCLLLFYFISNQIKFSYCFPLIVSSNPMARHQSNSCCRKWYILLQLNVSRIGQYTPF